MWITFHSLRSGELTRLWSCLFEDIGIQNSDTGKILNFVALNGINWHYCLVLLTQHVNLKVFEGVILKNVRLKVTEDEISPVTDAEANALRYVAGFVPFVLKKQARV